MRFGPDSRVVVEFWTLSNDQKVVNAFIGWGRTGARPPAAVAGDLVATTI